MASDWLGSKGEIVSAAKNYIAIRYSSSGKLFIDEYVGGVAVYSSSGVSISLGTTYYLKIRYVKESGIFGYLVLNVYSDSNFIQEITGSPLGLSLRNNVDYRYLFGINSPGSAAGLTYINGVVGDLAILEPIHNGHQLQTDFTTKSRVLVDTPKAVYQNTTAIPSRGDFETYSLYTKKNGAGIGRLSDFPGGNTGYANEKESCIWAGDEMLPSAFFTFDLLANSYNACTITTSQISFVAGTTLITDGYKPGDYVEIDGSTSNDRIIQIYQLTETTIKPYTPTTPLTASGSAENITLTATVPSTEAIDFTLEVQNASKTDGNVVRIGGEIDSSTVLMLHADGAEGTTTITDSSTSAHSSYTLTGGYLDSSVKEFGSASLKFTATSSYLDYSDCAHWYMGTGNFTIDFWVRFDTIPIVSENLFSQYSDNNNRVWLQIQPSVKWLYFASSSGGAAQWGVSGAFDPVQSQWYHIEVARINSTTLVMWVNGVEIGRQTITSTKEWPDLAGNFEINAQNKTTGSVAHYDEFRVSKGIARHTSNFTVPSRAYAAAFPDFLILTERPLQGIKPYVSEANTYSSTIAGRYWTGGEFSSLSLTDGTTSAGVALAQTGSISFSSTVADAKPFHFNGTNFYAYYFSLSAGSAEVYLVTVDAPFQPIVDIWDGVYRQPIEFQVYDYTNKTYTDYTLEILAWSDSLGTFGAELDMAANEDHFVVMFQEPMAAILMSMANSLSNSVTTKPIIDYYDGTAWQRVNNIRDETISDDGDWNSLGKTGTWSWEPVGANVEKPITLFASTGYAYSIAFNAGMGPSVTIDTVLGVPVQLDVKAFAFPAMYQNRGLLCNFKAGKQGNRIDYSVTDLPNTWNGVESSRGGAQSIYVGNSKELTGAAELYNQYGSSILATLAIVKSTETYMLYGTGPDDFRIYTISKNTGCPAPLTIAVAGAGLKLTESITRNGIFWLSYYGPVFFDGSSIYRIPGVENYFTPTKSEYINTSLITLARGWYDQKYDEYNLTFPSGSTATANNVWLVFNRKFQKWYEKSPYATYPTSAWPVYDTNGIQHSYAGTDDGYMLRLEYDTEWNDQPINHVWENGDFRPSKNIWDVFRMTRFKMIAPVIAETATVTIKVYTDTAASEAKSLSGFRLEQGSGRVHWDNQELNLTAQSYRFQYSVTMGSGTGAAEGALIPLEWGYRGYVDRKDIYN